MMKDANLSYVLRTGTMLKDRYRIDEVLGANGMTITYLAYDIFREQRIVIKELFPNSIAERNPDDGLSVSCVQYSNEADFFTMKSHMIKKAKTLISLYPLEGVANMINVFEENQTVYLVSEYAEGVSPLEFMQKIHSHPMQLKEILRLLNPVMNALDILHAKGIVHGRINPAMIRTRNKKVVLVSFGDPIEDAMMPVLEQAVARVPEYAAVEQYMEGESLCAETDVYAVAAIIYEAVTRIKVAPFYERIGQGEEEHADPVRPLKDFNIGIMAYQSDAIMKALSIYPGNRISSFEELLSLLSEDEFKEPAKIVMHKKPAYFAEKYKYIRTVRTVLAVGVIFLILFFGPKLYRYLSAGDAGRFYRKLDESNIYEQCRMVVELSDGKRKAYANDYNLMEEPELSDNDFKPDWQIHYYDKVTKRFVTNKQINLDADVVRYIRLDYRRNDTAILMFVDKNETRQVIVDLKPDIFDVYSVEESITDANGNTTYQAYKAEW